MPARRAEEAIETPAYLLWMVAQIQKLISLTLLNTAMRSIILMPANDV
jgi:hypothetical protein